MFELIGLLGSILFAISSVPQVYYTVKTKDTQGITYSFMGLYLTAAFSFTIYALMTRQYVLLPNYVLSFLGMSIIAAYKIRNHLTKGSA